MAFFEAKQLIGQRIDRYELQQLIGEGGHGAVYRARHVFLNQDVALKVLKDVWEPASVSRFLQEASLVSRLRSPHIVEVLDCGLATFPFLALKLLEGTSLSTGLETLERRGESLAIGDALSLVHQVLLGLEVAHREGIVHRDVKPSNVFLEASEAGYRAVLMDFGVAKSGASSRLTRTGVMIGTPYYAAPEQLISAKGVDARADVYSAGVLLYRLLSGRYPVEEQGYERMVLAVNRHARTPLRSIAPQVPQALARVVDRAISREPNARPASAAAFMAEFAEACRAPVIGKESLRCVRMTQTLHLD